MLSGKKHHKRLPRYISESVEAQQKLMQVSINQMMGLGFYEDEEDMEQEDEDEEE